MAFDWGICEATTVLFELVALLWIIHAREGVGEIILRGGDPLGGEAETTGNLLRGHPARHLKP